VSAARGKEALHPGKIGRGRKAMREAVFRWFVTRRLSLQSGSEHTAFHREEKEIWEGSEIREAFAKAEF
jgi:hypothetical protein